MICIHTRDALTSESARYTGLGDLPFHHSFWEGWTCRDWLDPGLVAVCVCVCVCVRTCFSLKIVRERKEGERKEGERKEGERKEGEGGVGE